MGQHESENKVLVWTDSNRVKLVKDALSGIESEIAVSGVGGARENDVLDLAAHYEVDFADDLRQFLVDHQADYLLLAMSRPLDLEDVLIVMDAGVTLLTLEPLAGELHDLGKIEAKVNTGGIDAIGHVMRMPMFTMGPGYLSAASPQEVLGNRCVVSYESCGLYDTSSLFARLYDAWFTVLRFIEMPETVDASLIGPMKELPDHIVNITGTMSVHARLADGGSVLLQVSDRTGQNHRVLHVIGEEAELRVTNTGYDLRHPDGSVIDHQDEKAEQPDYVKLIVSQWKRLIEAKDRGEDSARELPSSKQVLASCLACLLSARTGQPESPIRLLQMK